LANTINQSILKIRKQTQNLKQFITDVSHEFKTPLMVINSKIDLYKKLVEKGKSKPGDLDILL
jgi:signal transduction histidine kinase